MDSGIENAHSLCSLGRFQEALVQFRALELESVDPSARAGLLLDQATCYSEIGTFEEARVCVERAKLLITDDLEASVQIDLFAAKMLVKEGDCEQAVAALSDILKKYPDWLSKDEGRELYQDIQVQRAFTLMHIPRYEEARPILEEVVSFPLDNENMAATRCHLGRCYFEVREDHLAQEQFSEANRLGIPEEWEANFHYHFGYTLYNLKEFSQAKREFILCLQSGSPPGPPLSLKYKMLASTSRKLGEHDQARLFEKMAES